VLGLSDMAMPDQLYLYMVGGQKRPMVNMCIHSVPYFAVIMTSESVIAENILNNVVQCYIS